MSSGSGGGSSGEVSWPNWISTLHRQGGDAMWLAINSARAVSPFIGMTTYDPDTEITYMGGELATLNDHIDNFDPASDWADMIDTVKAVYDTKLMDDATLAAAVAAYSDILDDDLTNKTLPRFRSGMRDINAVQSSAFVIGQSLLEAFKAREVAKYAADYRGDAEKGKAALIIQTAGKLLEPQLAKLEMRKASAELSIDASRIMIVARKEERDGQNEIMEADHKWDFEKFNSYGNYIAGMSGGTAHATGKQPSTASSAIGGALSGAAAGGSMGGWWGAAGGAILGAGSAMMNR